MYDYTSMYKCRLCGKVYSISVTNNKVIRKFSDWNRGIKMRKEYSNKVFYHKCDDGSIGISDFVGFKYDKILPYIKEVK